MAGKPVPGALKILPFWSASQLLVLLFGKLQESTQDVTVS